MELVAVLVVVVEGATVVVVEGATVVVVVVDVLVVVGRVDVVVDEAGDVVVDDAGDVVVVVVPPAQVVGSVGAPSSKSRQPSRSRSMPTRVPEPNVTQV